MEIGPDDDRTATEVSVSAANTVNTIDPDRPMDLRRVIAMAGARRNATAVVIAHVEVSRGTLGTVEGGRPARQLATAEGIVRSYRRCSERGHGGPFHTTVESHWLTPVRS
jgi:hypothetical protein